MATKKPAKKSAKTAKTKSRATRSGLTGSGRRSNKLKRATPAPKKVTADKAAPKKKAAKPKLPAPAPQTLNEMLEDHEPPAFGATEELNIAVVPTPAIAGGAKKDDEGNEGDD